VKVVDSVIFNNFIQRNAASRVHAERAGRCVPTGTSRALLRHAPFAAYSASASGVETVDLDGNRRIDFHGNYTALIHGHAHPVINEAILSQLPKGTAYSAPPLQEYALAEHLCARIPSVEQVVFNNSGSEAVMIALRAARALTGRNRIAKFEGAYHGSSDFVMVGGHDLPALNDPCRLSIPKPDVGGLPNAATQDVILMRYNDPEAVRAAIREAEGELAALLIEPMLGAGGLIPAEPEFLAVVREETSRAGVVLICDEVITLRQAYGGAQQHYGFEPDLTTMAKIIGGGFPIGAVGGKREFMRCFEDPSVGGSVANLGTFSANPISTTAGLAAMNLLDAASLVALNELGDYARGQLATLIERRGLAAQVSGTGSLFQIHWTLHPLRDMRSVETANPDLKLLTFLGLCNRGIQVSMRGMCALSTPMTNAHVDALVAAFADVVTSLENEGWPVHR